ncbi:phosphatidylglycerophosphatase and protein-tyrosine phosphatase 1 isoform X2 [Dendrobates tinctorius]|uniref:phosphatidylglycerophosphatase and protein-tyrosine phosphatase 1 isoform X2 n=1 Tax=Dendrobates tinctorius TaxID=92724 RepID=UPI003CC9A567
MSLQSAATRVLFYPTLLYNVVMEKISRRKWYDRIDEAVILGALPFRGMSDKEWEALGVEQLRLSTVDFTGVPTLEHLQKGVEFVHKHRTMGNSVYIHCKAGRSRSATMVAAYLIERYKWKPDVAGAFIAEIRPHILIRSRQHQMLERFYLLVTNSDSPGHGG